MLRIVLVSGTFWVWGGFLWGFVGFCGVFGGEAGRSAREGRKRDGGEAG